jgi:hypothetical protein
MSPKHENLVVLRELIEVGGGHARGKVVITV